jgi:hypothetical protein
MTYLPDPMARVVRACFIGHPAMREDETLEIPLYKTGEAWPDARPFRVELFEHPTDKPSFNSGNRSFGFRWPRVTAQRSGSRCASRRRTSRSAWASGNGLIPRPAATRARCDRGPPLDVHAVAGR